MPLGELDRNGKPEAPSTGLPRISLVTPSFNQAEYLEATLRSVLDQGYPNLEYVVVDGGSTDGSREILERYADRLAWWVSEPDRGHAHAINKGFARTTGEIMGWLNSDDLLMPGSLSLVASAFAVDPAVEWITSAVTVLNPAGEIVDSWSELRWTRNRFYSLSDRWIQQESTLWRRSLWDRAGGGLDEDLLACDFELWARFFRHASLVHVRGAIGAFRFQPAQKSRAQRERYLREARKIVDHELDHPELATLPDERAEIRSEICFDLGTWRFARTVLSAPPPSGSPELVTISPGLRELVVARSMDLPAWGAETQPEPAALFPSRTLPAGEPVRLLWLGSGAEQGLGLWLQARRDLVVRCELCLVPGPARQDKARTLRVAAVENEAFREIASLRFDSDTHCDFELPLRTGLNRISLSIVELPDLAARPGGDSRPLLAALTGVRLGQRKVSEAFTPSQPASQAGPGDELSVLTAAVARLEAKLVASQRAMRPRAARESAGQRRLVDQLSAELNAMRSSWSWRITAPLRRLMAPFVRQPPQGANRAGGISSTDAANELEPAGRLSAPESSVTRAPEGSAISSRDRATGSRRIAFVGHSYHFTTGSNLFLLDLLRQRAEVEVFRDTSWRDDDLGWLDGFDSQAFDCIVLFQSYGIFDRIGPDHPNVVFIPMYDGMRHGDDFHWDERFDAAKVLCLSSALYRQVRERTSICHYAQYCADPVELPTRRPAEGLNAFFWYRRPPITPELLSRIAEGTTFDRWTSHGVPDPGVPHAPAGARAPRSRFPARTDWFADRAAFLSSLAEHSVFFASRLHEGIGMSFLEAMAMGLCVVAPDTPTHNEYISHGTNGLLYDPDRPRPLCFDDATRLGERARESAARGRARWEADLPRLVEFIETPRSGLAQRPAVLDFHARSQRAGLSAHSAPSCDLPKVTVITVCLEAASEIERTLRSVSEQDYPRLEYVVLDGGSTDGTVEILRRHAERIAFWRSEPDEGVYPAMASALGRASGEFVLFMNAGDTFASPSSLRALFAGAPGDVDVVYGHHIYLTENGIDEYRRVRDFETTWGDLRAGRIDGRWLEGMPCHQATAVRTEMLRQFGFDPDFAIAADHELYFRLRRAGRNFFNADETTAIYRGGGMSARRFDRCLEDWLSMAVRHGRTRPAWRMYRRLGLPAASAARVVLRGWRDRLRGRARARFPC